MSGSHGPGPSYIGYTQVPNHLLEHLVRGDLTKNQYKVVFLVIRKTLGWHRDAMVAPLPRLEEETGVNKSNLHRTIKALTDENRQGGPVLGMEKRPDGIALWIHPEWLAGSTAKRNKQLAFANSQKY